MGRDAILAGVAILAALVFSRKAHAAVPAPPPASVDPDPYMPPAADPEPSGVDWWPWLPALDPPPLIPIPEVMTEFDRSLSAFIGMIHRAEHDADRVASGMHYHTTFGNGYFWDMSDHPGNTGEFQGVTLPDEWCRRAGFPPGCKSYAAGAPQITRDTWRRLVRRYGRADLPDFSRASQDRATVLLLHESGAYAALEAGDWQRAVELASPIWASLAFSRSGQPQRTLAQLREYYERELNA